MAKRNNDNGPIDSYEDLEMEDIDDFDPFDVLDDSYDDRRVYKNPKAPKSTDNRHILSEHIAQSCPRA